MTGLARRRTVGAATAGPARVTRSLAAATCVLLLVQGCGAADDGSSSTAMSPALAGARPPTGDEINRLASSRSRAHGVGVRSVDGTVVWDGGTARIHGWIDTSDHWAYGLVTGPGIASFVAAWNDMAVSVQEMAVDDPPLPVPRSGWSSTTLDPDASHLAAAQVLLVSLASPTPDNPQLLRQNGVSWIRADHVGAVPVDVLSGPVPEGAATSGLRYWIDADGTLLRLEARLDGTSWSTFTFTDTPEVSLERPTPG